MKSEKRWVWLIFFVCLAVRVAVFFISENDLEFDFDPFTNVLLAVQWVNSANLVPDLAFAPLNTYLIAFLIKCGAYPVMAGRLLSLFFGSLTVFPYYYFLKQAFDRRTALFSAGLLCVYPIHVNVSVVSHAVALFAFLIVSAMFFIFKFLKEKRLFLFLLAALSVNLAAMARFEGGVFIIIMSVLLLKERKKYLPIFLFLACIFPVLWMLLCYAKTGSLFYSAAVSGNATYHWARDVFVPERLFNLGKTFLRCVTPLTAVIGGLGLVAAFYRRRYLAAGCVFIFLSALTVYGTIAGRFDPLRSKYFCMPGLFLLPYVPVLLFWAADRLRDKRHRNVLVGSFAAVLFFVSAHAFIAEALIHKARPEIRSLVYWLRTNVKSGERVVLDDYYHPYFLLESGLPLCQFLTPDFFLQPRKLRERISSLLNDARPEYIIYSFSSGNFRNALEFDESSENGVLGDFVFERVFQHGKYVIYKVKYASLVSRPGA